jgi:hypothetical protein
MIKKGDVMEIKEIDGVKCFEVEQKISVKVSSYGIKQVKGSDLQAMANIPMTFLYDNDKEYTVLSGYLNNKLIPNTDQEAVDSYGDVPTGKNVYDIERLINNPVALVDHNNSASCIAGNYIFLKEDKQGLKFIEVLRPLEDIFDDRTKDAVSAWSKGFGVAYSIGGRWYYDMEKSKPEDGIYYLVKAIVHEASHVGIGADKWALSVVPDTSMHVSKGDIAECKTLDEAVEKYCETGDERYLDVAENIKKGEKK